MAPNKEKLLPLLILIYVFNEFYLHIHYLIGNMCTVKTLRFTMSLFCLNTLRTWKFLMLMNIKKKDMGSNKQCKREKNFNLKQKLWFLMFAAQFVHRILFVPQKNWNLRSPFIRLAYMPACMKNICRCWTAF